MMIIEQPEAFKTWLTAVLKPMCEADPAALAKYVLALIRKDKSEEELHRIMVGQLQVFLEDETESFVALVLRTLETQDYLTTPVIPNANPPNPTPLRKSPKPIVPPSELPSLPTADPVNGKHDTKAKDEKRSRPRPRSRSRSRSRSWERKSRARPRQWRNKSPPPATSSRRRSRTRTPPKRRYRARTPPQTSPIRQKEDTPTQDSNHADVDLRLTNSAQSIQSVVVGGAKRRCRDFDEKGYCMRGEMCPFDHGVDPVVLEDSALSSVLTYDVGAMARGGVPPPEYNPQAPQMWNRGGFRGRPRGGPMMGAFPAQRELIPVPVLDNKQPPEGYFRPQQPPPPADHHDHSGPPPFKKRAFDFARLGPRGVGANNKNNPQNCSLELKKIPMGLNSITHLNNHFSKFGNPVNIQVCYDGDPEAAIITFSSHAEANAAYRSTEAVLNNRFIKVFWHNGNNDGKQENVPPRSVKDRLGTPSIVPPNTNKVLNLVQPRADEGGAAAPNPEQKPLNKEETKAQATAAIKKNQELLATKEKLKKNQDEQRKEVLKIKNDLRKRKQELLEKQLTQQKILIEKMEKLPPGQQRDHILDTIKKTQESIESIKKDLIESVMLSANKNAPHKKAKEDVQREMLDAELDLITKQQEGADTSEIQKKIVELKMRAALARGRGRGGRRYTQVSRHLLSKNNLIEGGVVKGGAKKPTAGFQKHTVDHRPTRLLVSGYEADEQDGVLNHFQSFGEICDYAVDATLPSITLNYKTRKEAEMALLKGKYFHDRTLSITWCTSNSQSQRSTPRKSIVSETEEDRLIEQTLPEADDELGPEISEEALLQDDEEEEEENEDRSWRR